MSFSKASRVVRLNTLARSQSNKSSISAFAFKDPSQVPSDNE